MARAAIKTGVLAGVLVGTDELCGASEFTHSGLTMEMTDANEFGYAVNKKVPTGVVDPGTISVPNVLQDPANAAQIALEAACAAGTEYGPDDIKFKRDATSYWTPGAGGTVTCTKAGACGAKRNGLVPTNYEFQVSGAPLVLKPSLVSIAVTGGALTVAKGASLQMVATGTYSSGPTAVLTTQVVWTSADEAILVVTKGGLAVGLATDAGTIITATLLGISGSASVATTGF